MSKIKKHNWKRDLENKIIREYEKKSNITIEIYKVIKDEESTNSSQRRDKGKREKEAN